MRFGTETSNLDQCENAQFFAGSPVEPHFSHTIPVPSNMFHIFASWGLVLTQILGTTQVSSWKTITNETVTENHTKVVEKGVIFHFVLSLEIVSKTIKNMHLEKWNMMIIFFLQRSKTLIFCKESFFQHVRVLRWSAMRFGGWTAPQRSPDVLMLQVLWRYHNMGIS